ncbi:hypothetical protein PC114_g16495 [Phytophthora cactorum]|nr:hypothetical protein PC114_g16495 [Phytophthora cactorum]
MSPVVELDTLDLALCVGFMASVLHLVPTHLLRLLRSRNICTVEAA